MRCGFQRFVGRHAADPRRLRVISKTDDTNAGGPFNDLSSVFGPFFGGLAGTTATT
jgi:hypothetical protein